MPEMISRPLKSETVELHRLDGSTFKTTFSDIGDALKGFTCDERFEFVDTGDRNDAGERILQEYPAIERTHSRA